MAAPRKISKGSGGAKRIKLLPGKTLGETNLVRLVEEQDRISLRDGDVVQTRLDISSLPLSILKVLRPIVNPSTPVTVDDLDEFWHDFRVEWLLLQNDAFKDYISNSEELRVNQHMGESARIKRLYSELATLFGPYEGLPSVGWGNSIGSKAKFLEWLLDRSIVDSGLVKRTQAAIISPSLTISGCTLASPLASVQVSDRTQP